MSTDVLRLWSGNKPHKFYWRQVFFRPSMLTAGLYFVFMLLVTWMNHYHAVHYVHIGTYFSVSRQHPFSKANGYGGYDGQFYYFIARNPFTAYKFMDSPPYRYERIVYPLLALILSLGQARWIPAILLLINFVSIVISVEIVSQLLIRHRLSPWYSLAFGLYFGQVAALVFDTAEPLTYLFVCLGLLQIDKKHMNSAALWMVLAVLARETAILFPVGFIAFYLFQRRWLDALRFSMLGVLPALSWFAVLSIIFKQLSFSGSPAFELIPFLGLFTFYHSTSRMVPLILLMFIPTMVGWILAAKMMIQRRWGDGTWLIWLMHLGLVTCMAAGSYVELVSAGRISMGLILALLLYGWQTRSRLILWSSQLYTLTFPVYAIGMLLRHYHS